MCNDAEFFRITFQQSIIEHNYGSEGRFEVDIIDISELTEKILLLPEYMKFLLFMKYIFYFDSNTVENILSIRYAKQKLRYAETLLAYSLRLTDEQFIAKSSMEKAVNVAMDRYMLNYNVDITVKRPHYSNNFRKVLKEIKAAKQCNSHIALKRVGIALIAASMSLLMAISVSAELRSRFFNWLVETFPLFSQFSAVNVLDSEQSDFEQLKHIKLNYIPDGFTLTDLFEADPMIVYSYEDQFGKVLSINASIPTGSPIQFDTEGVQINEVIFNEQIAYWWEKDGFCYLIWQKNGLELNIVGQISYEEALKILENIEI